MPFFKFSNEGMQGMRQRYDPCYVNYFLRFFPNPQIEAYQRPKGANIH